MSKRPSDQEIARALREHARAEGAPGDDRLLRELVRGEASAEEIEALRERAAHDAGAREDLALFEPVSDAEQARYADAVLGALARPAAPATATPRARRRWVAPVAAALAMAAAVTLVLARRPSPERDLPAYALTLSGGEAEHRSLPAEAVPLLAPGSQISIILRPANAVGGPLSVRVFLVQGDRAEPVDAEIKLSSTGAAQITARLGARLGAAAGEAEIVGVVARPEAAPPADLRDARAIEGAGRVVSRRRVRIAEGR